MAGSRGRQVVDTPRAAGSARLRDGIAAPKTVLVVEDDASVARLVRDGLERAGFTAIVAADGEAGVEAARRHQPDVIVLDIMLPKLDGWAVASRLRASKPTAGIPILMVSIIADRPRGLEAGAVDYMTKPFTMSELLARVRRLAGVAEAAS